MWLNLNSENFYFKTCMIVRKLYWHDVPDIGAHLHSAIDRKEEFKLHARSVFTQAILGRPKMTRQVVVLIRGVRANAQIDSRAAMKLTG